MDIPSHIGFIMDGNRRWAKQRNLPTLMGHKKGQEVLRELLHEVFARGVHYVSVYAFSTENWSRESKEVGYLMKQVIKGLEKYIDEFHEAEVKVAFLGRRSDLDESVRTAVEKAEAKTADNTRAMLGICFNYGGQAELVDAYKKLIQQGIDADDINEERIAAHLYYPEMPPCDLIVRTSGEQRLSNFMLWRAAYSEILFVDKNWPDMTKQDVAAILEEYKRRNRRFGG